LSGCPCLVLTFAAIGASAPKGVDVPTKPAQVEREVEREVAPPVEKPPYAVDGLNWKSDGSIPFVVGTVTNQTAKRWSYVQIQINILDKDGGVLGSTLANANNIEPGQKWKFKALATEAKAGSTFKVGEVTYY
jgi:hypothetical protein